MLYVSAYDKANDRYGVTDTDDNTTEWRSSGALFKLVKETHLRIQGVDLGVMSIKVVKPGVTPSMTKKFANAGTLRNRRPPSVKSRFDYLSDNIGFDYIVEQHETRDFTEYVISIGGDVKKYRVYGKDGQFRLVAK